MTTTTPWADTPFPLIPTPGRGLDLSPSSPNHSSIYLAREMACAHNGMLRALNSIYNQCLYVSRPQDVKDLLTYTKFWAGWIHVHHDAEGEMFFPDVERITGVKGWGEGNIAQHRKFEAGLKHLEDFVKGALDGREEGRRKGGAWDGKGMRRLIDSFANDLAMHLKDEIQTLLALKEYDSKALREAWDAFDLELRKGDKSILFPIVFGAGDNSYEEGFEWPVVPGFVRTLVHYWFERKYRGAWRFSPSTTWGERRALAFGPGSSA